MQVITINLNGIRSAAKKGFFAWLRAADADIICLQETRAHQSQLTDTTYFLPDYHHYFCDADKKGYSGVAIYSRNKPMAIKKELGWPVADQEGRFLQLDFQQISVISLYLPSGTSGDHRQALKYQFMDKFTEYLHEIKQQQREYIICGDWNIAHQPIDLKNWRGNQKNSGFLPEERAWLNYLFNDIGFVDAFRVLNQEPEQYTWWSNRGRAREKNVGWRIDYQIITPGLKNKLIQTSIYKEQFFSDHAPLIINYDINL